MEAPRAASEHQWVTSGGATTDADAAFAASISRNSFGPQSGNGADWVILQRIPPEKAFLSVLPLRLILSMVLTAVAYLLFWCAKAFGKKRRSRRRLAGIEESGQAVSCTGGEEANNDGNQRGEEDTEVARLKGEVEEIFRSVRHLTTLAEPALFKMKRANWVPAGTILITTCMHELSALTPFLDADLEIRRQVALTELENLWSSLKARLPSGSARRTKSGRLLVQYWDILRDLKATPPAGFPWHAQERMQLRNITIMASLCLQACKTALTALSRLVPTEPSDCKAEMAAVIEVMRRARSTRLRQILSDPKESKFLEEHVYKPQVRSLISLERLTTAREFGKKDVNAEKLEFELYVGESLADLKQYLQTTPTKPPPIHPSASALSSVGARGPDIPHCIKPLSADWDSAADVQTSDHFSTDLDSRLPQQRQPSSLMKSAGMQTFFPFEPLSYHPSPPPFPETPHPSLLPDMRHPFFPPRRPSQNSVRCSPSHPAPSLVLSQGPQHFSIPPPLSILQKPPFPPVTPVQCQYPHPYGPPQRTPLLAPPRFPPEPLAHQQLPPHEPSQANGRCGTAEWRAPGVGALRVQQPFFGHALGSPPPHLNSFHTPGHGALPQAFFLGGNQETQREKGGAP